MDKPSFTKMRNIVEKTTKIKHEKIGQYGNYSYNATCGTIDCSDYPPLEITLGGSKDDPTSNFTLVLESKFFLKKQKDYQYILGIVGHD